MKLFGTHRITLDEKFRARIPSRFRPLLGERVVVVHGATKGCLFIYTEEEFDAVLDKATSIPLSDEEAQIGLTAWIGSAFSPEEDSQGRFVLPETARRFASIDKKLVFVGVINRVEIWAEEVYENREFCSQGAVGRAMNDLKKYGF